MWHNQLLCSNLEYSNFDDDFPIFSTFKCNFYRTLPDFSWKKNAAGTLALGPWDLISS